MKTLSLDSFEQKDLRLIKYDLKEKVEVFNKNFKTGIQPTDGMYGLVEEIRDNGSVLRTFRNADGLLTRDYWRDDKIYLRREKLSDGAWLSTKFDDNGTGYLKSIIRHGEIGLKEITSSLEPNIEIVKGNFTAITDSYGRPVLNRVTDLTIKDGGRESLNIKKDTSYRAGDQKGHLIADNFGGPATRENIVAQMSDVNQSKMKQVENIVRDLKEQGAKIDYEVKSNYVGDSKRPTSFEPRITADGKHVELPDGLKKIYNDNLTSAEKVRTTVDEYTSKIKMAASDAHSMGKKEGLEAATITLAISTVDNTVKFIEGEITAEEMVMDIIKDTGTAGAVGYGSAFISSAVSQAMSKSSQALIQSLGNSGIPAAVISLGIDSYDSISDYAQGNIDEVELLYDLGDSAATVAGSMVGATLAGAAMGSVVPGAGTVVGAAAGLVGGMVGCAVASEAYATAIEIGADGAQILADKAKELADGTVKLAENVMPDSVLEIKDSINLFAKRNNLPFAV